MFYKVFRIFEVRYRGSTAVRNTRTCTSVYFDFRGATEVYTLLQLLRLNDVVWCETYWEMLLFFFFFFLLERSTRYLSFLLSSCTFCSIVFCISCSVAPRLILSHCTVTHSQLSVGWEGFPPRRLACSHWKQLLEKLTVVSKSLPCFFSTLLHPRIFFLSCLRLKKKPP